MGHAGWAAGAAEIRLPGKAPDAVPARRWRDASTGLFGNVPSDGSPVSG
jgi:hypothetical protein